MPRAQLLEALTSEAAALVALADLEPDGGASEARAASESSAGGRGGRGGRPGKQEQHRGARLSVALKDYEAAVGLLRGGRSGKQGGSGDAAAAEAAAVALEFGLFCNRLREAGRGGDGKEEGGGGGGTGLGVEWLDEGASAAVERGGGLAAMAVAQGTVVVLGDDGTLMRKR